MAVSYLSQQPFVSSEPIPSIDLNLMASVLQQKQSMFDANFEKAQSQLSTISSLDMLRDDDKQYRDSKLNELTKNLNKMNGDFSDPNISSQIDNSISSIYSDSRILNAVSSTKSIRALQEGYKKMQSDPKMAKYYSDANYDADMAEVERYMSSTDPNDTYRGKSAPTTFASYMPDLIKAAEKVKADGWQSLGKGIDGFYNVKSGEIVSSEKISNDIMGILDSNQRAQLMRDGNFMWGKKLNLSAPELISKLTSTVDYKIRNAEENIEMLKISKKGATVDEAKLIDARIKEYSEQLPLFKSRKQEIENTYNEHLKNGGSLESLRYMAYQDDIAKTLGNLYSWSKTKEDTKVNQYRLEDYKSLLRQNEMELASNLRIKQIREAAKYRDNNGSSSNDYIPPIANADKTPDPEKNQVEFNNQLGKRYNNELINLKSENPAIPVYAKNLQLLAEGKPAVLPAEADDLVFKSDVYGFAADRVVKANLAPMAEAVWKMQNSFPVIENEVDKKALQNIKLNILNSLKDPTKVNSPQSVDDIKITGLGISKKQYRRNKEGALEEDNNFYAEVEVKQGGKFVSVDPQILTPEYVEILSNGKVKVPSEESLIINRGVDEKHHFSTVVQSKVNPKLAFKITVAKLKDGFETFIEHEGQAIPISALDINLPKRAPFAWTSLEVARAYLKNKNTREEISKAVKNYKPNAKDPIPEIRFDNHSLYSSAFDWSTINIAPGPGRLNVLK